MFNMKIQTVWLQKGWILIKTINICSITESFSVDSLPIPLQTHPCMNSPKEEVLGLDLILSLSA